MKNQLLLLSVLLLSRLCASDCVHDQYIKNTTMHYYDDLAQSRRLLQAPVIGNMRIFMDYGQVTEGTTAQKNSIQRLMNITANYMYNLLTVERLPILFFPAGNNQTCNNVNVPIAYTKVGVTGDVGIMIKSEVSTLGYIAKATSCAYLLSNKRPIWGAITWNINQVALDRKDFFQQLMGVALHEMTHVLAMSTLLFPNFPKGSVLVNNATTGNYYLNSASLNSEISQYFSCSSAPGLQLQDQDGTLISSHWQRHHVGNEFMVGSNKKNSYVSKFTLRLYESTGWYPSVNFSMAEPMYWGKGKGCSFLNNDNCNFTEFCVGSNFGCDWDSTAVGRCQVDLFSGSCSVEKEFDNTICIDEDFELKNINSYLEAQERGGYQSRCFLSDYRKSGMETNLLTFRCYSSVCSATGAYIYLLIAGYTLVCKSANQVIQAIPGFDGTLTCPSDFKNMCNAKKTCPYHCNKNGVCINGKCMCTGSNLLTSTCPDKDPSTDIPYPSGGRILFQTQTPKLRVEQNKKVSKFENKCPEGYIFDPINNRCELCMDLLGCVRCSENGCLQ